MPKVRLRYGATVNGGWQGPGEVVEVDDDTARLLVESSQADEVGQVETAAFVQPEVAAQVDDPPRRRRKRHR